MENRSFYDDKDVAAVSWLLNIPLPLLYDILIRIPSQTTFSCRCVCTSFLKILTDHQYARDHFTRAETTTDEEALVIQNTRNAGDILLVYNYRSELEKPYHANSHCQTLSIPTGAPSIIRGTFLIGSCNGFLCINYLGVDQEHMYYYVCNPILGEFLVLPPCDTIHTPHLPAFGFCPKTNQYKVIFFFTSSLCKILTLGTDRWREITGDLPHPYYYASYDHSFRGILHLIDDHITVSERICSFNLETEQASYLPTPNHLAHDTRPKSSCFQIGTLGGSLCLSYHLDTTLEVCVMKNYGVKESWSRAFSIDLGLNPGFQKCDFVCGYTFINGDFFYKHKQSSLVCHSLQKGTVLKLLADDVPFAHIRNFRPSLISLKDVAGDSGENVEVVERKMRRNNWSDKGFQFIY